MKAFKIIANVVVALAAVAGIVYAVATYGDKIVAWFKNILSSCPLRKHEEEIFEVPAEEEIPVEDLAEEAAAEEPAAEEAVAEDDVVANDADFEG